MNMNTTVMIVVLVIAVLVIVGPLGYFGWKKYEEYTVPGNARLYRPDGWTYESTCEYNETCNDLRGRTVTMSDGSTGECYLNGVACASSLLAK